MAFSDSAEELRYLQHCMSDLVSMLALPAVWSGQEPRQIVTTFHDALMATLNLDFLYARVKIEADGESIEELRAAPPYAAKQSADTIRRALNERFGDEPRTWPAEFCSHLGALVSMRLGIDGEIGIIVAGSGRAGFPTQSERLLLGVAANQAALGLQQAGLLSQQKRVADELERRVAERTASLAAANEELKKEIAERKIVERQLLESEKRLKTSETKLRQVIDTIPSLSWCNLPDGANEFLSKGWHDYTGLSPEKAHGWGWQDAIHPDDRAALVEYWRSCVASGTPVETETRVRRFDGAYRWFIFRANPLRDESGAVVRWYGTNIDIEDRKRSEDALTRARAALAHVAGVTSLGVLTASIAHEVNQPLSGIVTNASTCLRMLNSDPPNIEGARETARRTIRDGNRASDIITRLRALFKGKEVYAARVDLNDAAREVIALSLSELQRNRITVRHELAESLPAVKGDRVQLQQVIQNLLRNASDSMSDIGDRPRQLLIRTESDDGKHVQLTVQDTGVGIASEAADRMFDAFYTTKEDGMGIGLSVSRSIVEAHQGRLWAVTNDGPGSSFIFSIPSEPGSQLPQDR